MGCNHSGQQAVAFTLCHLICVIVSFATPWLSFLDTAEASVGGTVTALGYKSVNYWLSANLTVILDGDKNIQSKDYVMFDWPALYETTDPFKKPLGQASAISIACLALQLVLGLFALGFAESSRFSVWGRCCISSPQKDGTTCCGRTVGRMPCGQNPVTAAVSSNRLHVVLVILSLISLITYPVLMRDSISQTRSTQTIGPVTLDKYSILSAGFAFQVIAFIMLISASISASRWVHRSQEELAKKRNPNPSEWPKNRATVVEMNPVSMATPGYPVPGAAALI